MGTPPNFPFRLLIALCSQEFEGRKREKNDRAKNYRVNKLVRGPRGTRFYGVGSRCGMVRVSSGLMAARNNG